MPPTPLSRHHVAPLQDAPAPRTSWLGRAYTRYVLEASFRRQVSLGVAFGVLCLSLLLAVVNAWQGGSQNLANLVGGLVGVASGFSALSFSTVSAPVGTAPASKSGSGGVTTR